MANLKLGLQLGYWGSGPPPDAAELVGRGRAPRLRLGVDGRGLRLRRPHSAGMVGLGDHTGAPRAPRCASCRRARPRPWPWRRSPWTICRGGRFVLGPRACRAHRSWRAGTASPSRSPWPAPASTFDRPHRCWPAKAPVTNNGPHYPLPYPGRARAWASRSRPSSTRCAPTSRSSSGPRGRRTWRLAAEIADGWFPIFFSPAHMGEFSQRPRRGIRPPRGPPQRGGLRGHRLLPHHRRRRRRARPRTSTAPCWPSTSAAWAPRR